MVRKYDTTFIIDGNLPDSERQALIERFSATVKRFGGEVDQVVRWGLRTLAYPINKRTHGYYVIFYYTAETGVIAQFERELRLNENILRYMTLVYEGKHPEYVRDETMPSSTPAPEPVKETEDEGEEDVESADESAEESAEENEEAGEENAEDKENV